MMDSFTGSFLSFLLRGQLVLSDPFVVRAALGFAKECAVLVGNGIGARHFPSRSWCDMLFAKYKDTIPIQCVCFISHSSEANETARMLAIHLRDQPHIDVWLNNIVGGQYIKPTIRDGVLGSDSFVLVLTQAAITSEWVKLEVDTWVARKVETGRGRSLIIPVIPTSNNEDARRLISDACKRFPVLDDCRFIELPREALRQEKALQELVSSVRLACGSP
jgi:TIR domain